MNPRSIPRASALPNPITCDTGSPSCSATRKTITFMSDEPISIPVIMRVRLLILFQTVALHGACFKCVHFVAVIVPFEVIQSVNKNKSHKSIHGHVELFCLLLRYLGANINFTFRSRDRERKHVWVIVLLAVFDVECLCASPSHEDK